MTDPTALPDFALPPQPGAPSGDPEENTLRARVLRVLTEMGTAPEVDEDGDVTVLLDPHRLYLRCTDVEPPLLRVFGQWQIDEGVPGDHLTRLEAANAVTGAIHLVKATLVQDSLVTAVDLIVADSLDLTNLLSAAMGMVVQSVQTWHATVVELSGGPS